MLLESIRSNRTAALNYKQSASIQDTEDLEAYFEIYRYTYLRECLVAEKNIKEENLDIIEIVIKNPDLTQREHVKIVNMHNTIKTLFKQILVPSFSIDHEFTVRLAQSLHLQVCKGLLGNAGQFRTKSAKPAGENFWYSEPENIESEIDKLFCSTRDAIKAVTQPDPSVEEIAQNIKIAASFLSKFLIIHPFSNGNGRVARLLCSCLLVNICVVPLSITEPRLRDTYLDCLRDVQYYDNQPPSLLATLLLERVWMSLEDFRVNVSSD